jgi:hypothetical protein
VGVAEFDGLSPDTKFASQFHLREKYCCLELVFNPKIIKNPLILPLPNPLRTKVKPKMDYNEACQVDKAALCLKPDRSSNEKKDF